MRMSYQANQLAYADTRLDFSAYRTPVGEFKQWLHFVTLYRYIPVKNSRGQRNMLRWRQRECGPWVFDFEPNGDVLEAMASMNAFKAHQMFWAGYPTQYPRDSFSPVYGIRTGFMAAASVSEWLSRIVAEKQFAHPADLLTYMEQFVLYPAGISSSKRPLIHTNDGKLDLSLIVDG